MECVATDADPTTIASLSAKLETLQEEFFSVTQQLMPFVERADPEETDQVVLIKSRESLKEELASVLFRLDSLTVAKTLYHRLGVVSNGAVNWSVLKQNQ